MTLQSIKEHLDKTDLIDSFYNACVDLFVLKHDSAIERLGEICIDIDNEYGKDFSKQLFDTDEILELKTHN